MVINYEDYKNDGWGISKLGFQQLYELIKEIPKQEIRVLEFGSGMSTKFFSDLSKILGKKVLITSFDDSSEYMYKDKSDPNVVVNLRKLEETDDAGFEQMFVDKQYDKNRMKLKTSTHLRNMFYSLEENDLEGSYDVMLLDGPHGNGRSLAYLLTNEYLPDNSIVFIDDYTHYDFVDKFKTIFDSTQLFHHIGGNVDKWNLGGDFIIFKVKKHTMNNIKVIDFRFAELNDQYELKYKQEGAWSRIYEYPYVTDFIKKNKDSVQTELHNTSWGFEGIHVMFRDELDTLCKCIHSDIVSSPHRETHYYDITTENKEFENKFQFVVNISTIEHLTTVNERISSIENLMKQVKTGGYLILTFDYPRVNLLEIETLVSQKCKVPVNALNGENSINPNTNYKNLNIVYLILQKNE